MIEDDELLAACTASRREHEERRLAAKTRIARLHHISDVLCPREWTAETRLALTQVAYLYTLPLMRPMATRFIHSVQQSSVFHAAQHMCAAAVIDQSRAAEALATDEDWEQWIESLSPHQATPAEEGAGDGRLRLACPL